MLRWLWRWLMLLVNQLIGFGKAKEMDPYWQNVVLLARASGADGTAGFTDDSRHARTLTGSNQAQVDTAQSKFIGKSILFDGVNDSVFTASHADFEFGSGQFTVEAWVRFSALTGIHQIVGKWGTTPRSWCLFKSSGANLSFAYDNGASETQINGGWTPSTGVWYHTAVDRDASNKFRVYVDGVMLGSLTESITMGTSSKTLRLGATDSDASDFAGWIEEVRITKGVARYASDSGFAVPTSAFPRS